MTGKQSPLESIQPTMSRRLPTLAPSICYPDSLELVWENGEIFIRGLPSKKKTDNYSYKAPGGGEASTAINRSNDGVVLSDSMLCSLSSGLQSKLDDRRYDKNNKISCLDLKTCSQVLSEFYEDGFNVVPEPETRSCYDDKQLDDADYSHVVPVNRFGDSNNKRSYDVSKVLDEIPNQTVNNIYPSCGASRRQTSSRGLVVGVGGEDLEGNVNAGSAPIETSNGSKNATVLPESELAQKDSHPVPVPVPVPDEQSEAVGYKDTKYYYPNDRSSSLVPNIDINIGKSLELQMVPSSSVCSRGASNCPTYTFTRRYHEDTELSEDEMEEPEGTTKEAPSQGSKGAYKRKRKTEVHNLSERRRRDKINKKMRALQDLIPNCNKVDKASMLDEAIEYLKTLKLQVQMMSMGSGFCMHPNPMMLPTAMQYLGGYSPMNMMVMGMKMQMGLSCGPAQFPTSLVSEHSRLNNINMLGFPAHMLFMSMSRSPFLPLAAARFSAQFVHTPGPGVSQAASVCATGNSSYSKNVSNPTN